MVPTGKARQLWETIKAAWIISKLFISCDISIITGLGSVCKRAPLIREIM
jgi:hypothetical protein